MSSVPPPLLSFLLMVVSGWVHPHQLTVMEFLQAENRLLKSKLGGKRSRFIDAERALLARKAKAVGRKALLKLDRVTRESKAHWLTCITKSGGERSPTCWSVMASNLHRSVASGRAGRRATDVPEPERVP
jgi:hypothetical protein